MGMSPSSRRAWIEIQQLCHDAGLSLVALLAEGVDRNCTSCSALTGSCVALLAEGVDRNTAAVDDNTVTYVALLAEGVDRNCAAAMT